MSIALATLVARLQAQVPARNGVPADYSQLVQDAVTQLAQDVPLLRRATLAIVAGTATYALPADYLFLVELPPLRALAPDGETIVTAAGLIPLGVTTEEAHQIEGGQIVFYPTPGYTVDRTLLYAAGHVLEAGSYPRLNENAARIALLYGQHLALMAQAAATAGDAWKYSIGDESVDKSGQAKGLQTTAEGLLTQYQLAIRGLKGRAP